MKYLVLTVGAPGVGKSTWIKESGLEPYALSADVIRLQIQGPITTVSGGKQISQKNDKRVWELLFQLLEDRMKNGEFIVIDATHSKESDFAKYKDLIEKYRYRLVSVDFRDVPIEECLNRNSGRHEYKRVPADVIEKIYSRFKNQKPPVYANLTNREDFFEKIAVKPTDKSSYEHIYVFGDIHGCYEPIKEFFDKNPVSDKNLYVWVGDLMDRGPQNGEVAQWYLAHHNLPNFILLQSNHGVHLSKWAFDMDADIRSNEFLFKTVPQLEAVGFDRGNARSIVRKEHQLAYFTFHDKEFLITHGGFPRVPTAFDATKEFTSGVGQYEDMEAVAESWLNNTSSNRYMVMGHRNVYSKPIRINDRVFNLEGKIEFGGHLRILDITKDGFNEIEIKNNVFRTDLTQKTPKQVAAAPTDADPINIISFFRSKTKQVYENRYEHISSFNFKKDVFYKDSYGEVKELPRGFFFNNQTNEVICRGYQKMYNLFEVEETKPNHLRENLKFPCQVYVKENGFLGLLGFDKVKNDLVLTSKSVVGGEFSTMFETIFIKYYPNAAEYFTRLFYDNDWCAAFEVIDPKNDPHIIEYNEPSVCLLDIFDRSVAEVKRPYESLMHHANLAGVPHKKLYRVLNNVSDLNVFLDECDNNQSLDIEGYVIEDSSGFKFKIKLPAYKKWKYYRGLKDRVAKGHTVNLGALNTVLDNEVYGFLKKKDRGELLVKSIIDIRKEFFYSKANGIS